MPGVQLDKDSSAELLTSVEQGLAYLRNWSVELSQAHETLPEAVRTAYGSMRRLRERLQRAKSCYGHQVQVELDDEDLSLMLSCGLFGLSRLDLMRPSNHANLDSEDLARRRRLLVEAIASLARRPVTMMPSRPDERGVLHTPSVMEAIRLAKARLASAAQPEAERPGSLTPRAATGSGFGIPDPAATPSGLYRGLPPAAGGGGRAAQPGVAPRRFAHDDAASALDAVFGEAPAAETTPPPAPAATPEAVPPTPVTPAAPAATAAPDPLPIDPDRIRDARLRSMLAMDLKALRRAFAAGDSRLVVVHLSSVLESVVYDIALPRANELGLVGTPDCWRPERVLGMLRPIAPKERTYLLHLISARNLLRPGTQLQNPTVITPPIAKGLIEFVRSVFEDLGVIDPTGVEFGMPPIPARGGDPF